VKKIKAWALVWPDGRLCDRTSYDPQLEIYLRKKDVHWDNKILGMQRVLITPIKGKGRGK
jgi:hypothetical protein